MTAIGNLLAVLIILLAVTRSGLALKCYDGSCDTGCSGSFDSSSVTESSDNCAYCRKITNEIAGTMTWFRACMATGSAAEECTDQNVGTVKRRECSCKTDLCNAGVKVNVPFTLLGILVVGWLI